MLRAEHQRQHPRARIWDVFHRLFRLFLATLEENHIIVGVGKHVKYQRKVTFNQNS